jgi:hypothetical protein
MKKYNLTKKVKEKLLTNISFQIVYINLKTKILTKFESFMRAYSSFTIIVIHSTFLGY